MKIVNTNEAYIDNVLFSGLDNSKVTEFKHRIASIKEDSTTWSDIASLMVEVSTSDLTDLEKCYLLKDLVAEPLVPADPLDESVMLEYSGKEPKNEEFKEILEEIDALITYFVKYYNKLDESFYKLSSLCFKVKKDGSNYKDILNDINNIPNEIKKYDNEISKDINGSYTWPRFRQKVNTFNNKYSDISMAEKKKLEEKISKIPKQLIEKWNKWGKGGEESEKLLDKLTELDKIDEAYTDKVRKMCATISNTMYNELSYTISDITYVCKKLNIKFENSLRYKLVQSLFKK